MTDETQVQQDQTQAPAPTDYVPARADRATATTASEDLDEENLADAPKELRARGISKVTWRTAGFDKNGKRNAAAESRSRGRRGQ